MQYLTKHFKKYKESINHLSIYFTANILQAIVGLIMTPITATYLSHYDFSVIGYFNSFNLFVYPIIGFSFFSYFAKIYFQIDNQERERTISTLLIGQAVFGLLSIIILLLCLKIYFVYNSIKFDFFPYSIYTFGTIYFSNFYTFILIKLKLEKNPKEYIRLNILNLIINTTATLMFVVLLKKGANGSMGGIFLTSIIIGTLSFLKQITNYKIDFKIISNALKFSWPLMLSALMTYFFNGFDRLILEKQNNIIEFGLYNVATKIASFFLIFVTSINSTFEPDFYSAIAQNDNKKLFKVMLVSNILIFIPVLVFLLLGDTIVGILTNYKYLNASNYTRILVLSNFVRSLSFSFSTIIIALGFTRLSLVEKSIGSLFAITINIIFIEKFGFYGGAWAQVVNYLIMFIISLIILLFISKNIKLKV